MKNRLHAAVTLSVCLTTLCTCASFESFYQHDSAQAKSMITQSNGEVLIIWEHDHGFGLLRLDPHGEPIWSKELKIGTPRALALGASREEFLVCCTLSDRLVIYRFDREEGVILDKRDLDFPGPFEWGGLVFTSDHQWVVGVTVTTPSGQSSIHLVKMNFKSGQTVRGILNQGHSEYVEAMCPSRGSGFWIAGGIQRGDRLDSLVLKVTNQLDRQWSTIIPADPFSKAVSPREMSGAFAVVEKTDGSAVVSGVTVADDHRPHLICTSVSSQGKLQWQVAARQDPTPCDGTQVFVLPDERILVTGNRMTTAQSLPRFEGLGSLLLDPEGRPLHADWRSTDSSAHRSFGSVQVGHRGEIFLCLNHRGDQGKGLLTLKYEDIDAFIGHAETGGTSQSLDGITVSYPPLPYGHFRDARDGREYRTIHIGTQVWFSENFVGRPPEPRTAQTKGIWSPAPVESGVKKERGFLYSFTQAKTLAPPGWRLPTKRDWETLFTEAGGRAQAGRRMQVNGGWAGRATQSCGFDALPLGLLYHDEQNYFEGVDTQARFWSDDEEDGTVMQVALSFDSPAVSVTYAAPRYYGLSVRYVRDAATESAAVAPQEEEVSFRSRREYLQERRDQLRKKLRRLRGGEQ